MATITGGPGDDIITASGSGDVIDGGGGTNTVTYAGIGADLNIAFDPTTGVGTATGDGTSTLTNIQNVIGGSGNDTFVADGLGPHVFDGGGGANTISLGTYQNIFGSGLHVQAISSVIDLTGGASTIQVKINGVLHTVTDTFTNFHTVQGFGGADLFIGTTGDDAFIGDSFFGGTVSYANAPSAVTVSTPFDLDLSGSSDPQNTGGGGHDTLSYIDGLIGSSFDDHLTATWVEGGPGDDVLNGGGLGTAAYASAPTGVTVSLALQGGAQNTGGAGTDTLTGFWGLLGSAFADHLTGDANFNTIDGGGGDDVLDGGGGLNTVSFASAAHGVSVSLALEGGPQVTGVGSVTLSNFQNLTGSAYDDTLEGDGGDNLLEGGGGTDTVSYAHAGAGVTVSLALQNGSAQNTGGAGNDTLLEFQNLTGSAFDDVLEGDYSNLTNNIDGGGGINTISYARATGGVTVSLALQGQAQTTQPGGYGTDTLSNFRNLTGSIFNDTLTGDANNNIIEGGGGYNVINGGGGVNTASYAHAAGGVIVSLAMQGQQQNTGGAGIDTLSNIQNLIGSAFNDTLTGDANNNVLTGGAGADTFVITGGADAVTDFSHAQGDKIDLSYLHSVFSLTDVLAAATQSGSNTVIDLGNGNSLTLDNVQKTDLVAGDFVFTPVIVRSSSDVAVIDATANLSATGQTLVAYYGNGGGTVINHGTLTIANASESIGSFVEPDPTALFENDGQVSASNTGTVIWWVTVHNSGTITGSQASGASSGDLTNSGLIAITNAGAMIGVQDWNLSALVNNQLGGTLQVIQTGTSNQDAVGVALMTGGEVDNAGTMTVTGSGSGSAYGVKMSGEDWGGHSTAYALVNNSGTLTVAGSTSIGIIFYSQGSVTNPAPAAGQYNIINSGTIRAGIAIEFASGAFAPGFPAAIDNSGTINGDVLLSDASDRLLNSGVINGAVNLGAGNDTLQSSAGTITGVVTLGSGSSTAILGSENNTVALAAGTHVVDGGGGTNTVSYASAASGVTVSLALQGQAQSTGAGTDTLSNFQNLTGSSHNDTLTGGTGTNALTGGAGADIFAFALGDGSQTITDFSHAQGDRIDLSAFHAVYSINQVLADGTQSGANTVIDLGGGTTVTLDSVSLTSLQAGDFIFAAPPPTTTANNFDGGPTSAVAFLNLATGDLGYMTANTSGGETWHPLGPTSTDYSVIAKGDFNGDGMADFAFRSNSTGDWGFMSVNLAGGETWHAVGPTSLAYAVLGSGDFNGDGLADIAFRNSATGDWGFMTPNASGGETWHAVGPSSTAYSVVAIGDFDNSGSSEIAFRDPATGDFGYMSVSGSGAEIWHAMGLTSTDYAAVGYGDFNADGLLDVAFRQTSTGDWGFMTINPGGGETWHGAGPASTAYAVIGAADYDGDGKTDLAFRDAAGDWGFMSINGSGGEVWHGVGPASTNFTPV